VLKGPHRTHNGNGHVENGVVKKPSDSTREGNTREGNTTRGSVRSLPPFHKLPTKTAPFSYLGLLSQERERALGEVRGEAVGRIDSEILDVLNSHTLSRMAKRLLTGEERTQVKIEKVLCSLSELIEELAVTQGTLHWLSKRGKEPYSPAYPPNLGATDLIGLRERLIDDLPE
jgi:hypothetical protein